MSKTIAIGASVLVAAGLGVAYTLTRVGTVAAVCGSGAVGGAAIGGPFELVDENGALVTDADIITEPTLVYFGFTFCPDFCPLDAQRNAVAVDILAEEGISATPVFISIDPARDTVDVIREYTENFHPKMIGLTGSDEQVAVASKAYKTVYQKQGDDPDHYLMQHSTFTYLMMPDTGFATFFRPSNTAEEVAAETACFARSA